MVNGADKYLVALCFCCKVGSWFLALESIRLDLKSLLLQWAGVLEKLHYFKVLDGTGTGTVTGTFDLLSSCTHHNHESSRSFLVSLSMNLDWGCY